MHLIWRLLSHLAVIAHLCTFKGLVWLFRLVFFLRSAGCLPLRKHMAWHFTVNRLWSHRNGIFNWRGKIVDWTIDRERERKIDVDQTIWMEKCIQRAKCRTNFKFVPQCAHYLRPEHGDFPGQGLLSKRVHNSSHRYGSTEQHIARCDIAHWIDFCAGNGIVNMSLW